jgi:hypothetical protein
LDFELIRQLPKELVFSEEGVGTTFEILDGVLFPVVYHVAIYLLHVFRHAHTHFDNQSFNFFLHKLSIFSRARSIRDQKALDFAYSVGVKKHTDKLQYGNDSTLNSVAFGS